MTIFITLQIYSSLCLAICTILTSCSGQSATGDERAVKSGTTTGLIVEQLPESICTIYQAKDSTFWFGSNGDGVFHYDGNVLTQFTTNHGLPGNQLRSIQEDASGYLYFETSGIISRYDGSQFETLRAVVSPDNIWKSEPDDLWFNPNPSINKTYRYDGENLYELTLPNHGFSGMVSSSSSTFSPYGVYSIHRDSKENLWFGTLSAGVYMYNNESDLWIVEDELLELDDGRAPGVRSIIEDKDGNYWLSNTLSRYSIEVGSSGNSSYNKMNGIDWSSTDRSMEFPYFLSAITDDANNDLWLITYSEGVWRYDGTNMFHYPVMIEGEKVLLFSIYEDRQGGLWLGSHNAGLFKFNGSSFDSFSLQ